MIDRNSDVRTNQDSLNRAYEQGITTPPTFIQSVFDHFTSSLFSESLATDDVEKMLTHAPKNTMLQDAYDYANLDLNNPNITLRQKISRMPFNFLSDMLGYTLGGPIGLMTGMAGGAAGEAISRGVTALAPEIVSPLVSSIGRVAGKLNKVGLETAGFMEPQAVLESYNSDNNKMDLSRLAEANTANYGIGIGLGSIGYAAGVIWKKAFTKVPEPIKYENLSTEMKIALYTGKQDEEIQGMSQKKKSKLAKKIDTFSLLSKKIVPISSEKNILSENKNISFSEIQLIEKNKENLSESINEDKVAMPGNSDILKSLSILRNAFDSGRITNKQYDFYRRFLINPKDKTLDRLASQLLINEGHPVDPINNKVNFQIANESTIKNLNATIIDQLSSDIPEEHRNALTDYIIHASIDEQRRNPIHPDLIHGLKGFVDYAEGHMAEQQKKLEYMDNDLDINLKNKKSISKEEREINKKIIYLRRKLLNEEDITKFNVSRYSKLIELSYISDNAKLLRKRINLKFEISKQKNLINVVESFRRILNSDLQNLSNPQKALDYLRYRIESKLPSLLEDVPDNVLKQFENLPAESEEIIEEIKNRIKIKKEEKIETLPVSEIKKITQSEEISEKNIEKTEEQNKSISENKDEENKEKENKEEKFEMKFVTRKNSKEENFVKHISKKENKNEIDIDKIDLSENEEAEGLKENARLAIDKFEQFKKSENVFNDFIKCLLGKTNG